MDLIGVDYVYFVGDVRRRGVSGLVRGTRLYGLYWRTTFVLYGDDVPYFFCFDGRGFCFIDFDLFCGGLFLFEGEIVYVGVVPLFLFDLRAFREGSVVTDDLFDWGVNLVPDGLVFLEGSMRHGGVYLFVDGLRIVSCRWVLGVVWIGVHLALKYFWVRLAYDDGGFEGLFEGILNFSKGVWVRVFGYGLSGFLFWGVTVSDVF